MTNYSPFRTDESQQAAPHVASPNTSSPHAPFGSGSAFGAPGGSPFVGGQQGGPLRPRRRGVGSGAIIVATVVPVIAAVGIFAWANRSANEARDEVLSSVQQVLDQTPPAAGAPGAAPVVPATPEEALELATQMTEPMTADAMSETAMSDAEPGTSGSPMSRDLLADVTALDPIVDQIAATIGAEDLQVLSVVLYPTYGSFSVQDPANATNVDNYSWRAGQLSDPIPVQLFGFDDLEASLFSASEVNWQAIPALVAEAPAAVSVEGGEVTHVVVERALPFSSNVRVRVFVAGPRDSGYVDGSADGTMISINGN